MTCNYLLYQSGLLILLFALLAVNVSILAQPARPNFVDPVDSLAAQLANAKSNDERHALLGTKKEFVTIDLRKSLVQRGNLLLTSGQYAKAFEVYGIAKLVAEQIGDKEGIAAASLDIGTVYYFQANYNAALEHYKQARGLFVQVGNNYEAAKALSGLALIYKEQRRDDDALRSLTRFSRSLRHSTIKKRWPIR